MQKYRFEVTFEDGTVTTQEVDQRDIRRWEAETEKSWLSEDMSLTSAARIAYYAMLRSGVFTGTWEDFDRQAVWVKEVADRERANPTRKGRTAG